MHSTFLGDVELAHDCNPVLLEADFFDQLPAFPRQAACAVQAPFCEARLARPDLEPGESRARLGFVCVRILMQFQFTLHFQRRQGIAANREVGINRQTGFFRFSQKLGINRIIREARILHAGRSGITDNDFLSAGAITASAMLVGTSQTTLTFSKLVRAKSAWGTTSGFTGGVGSNAARSPACRLVSAMNVARTACKKL